MRWLTCLCVALVLCISVGAAADRQLEQAAFQDSHPLVAFYQQGERITRVYGPAFGHGATPEAVAEQFRTNHAGIFGVDAGDLVPVGALADGQHTRPLMLDPETGEYKFTLVYFTQQHDGVPIFRSELRLLVRNLPDYPLVWVGSSLHDLGDFRRTTNVANDQAGVQAALDFSPGLMNFSAPEAVIWAGVNDQVVEPALAATFTADNYDNPSAAKPEKWLFVTDAQTGEILYKENMIIFEDVVGHADGNATQGIGAEHCELEAPEALKWARVGIGTTYAHADANGDFVIPNSGTADVTVESWLRGLWFRVYNAAGADAALSQVVTPPGPAYFLHNEANTEFYRAQVNGYVEANVIRDMVISHYPDYPGLQQSEFPVNVNLTGGYCPGNAWYDYSSINFCLAASGYPNTAWGAVIHHE
ncbi:MAG: hypothetical protein KKB50_13395 [Planctomycetes bacterium]|nr:hypothetical protein [Planctomycetota bacterium]